ncbi:TrmO family methyltransferase domain-containing protein [Streptomyces sp. NPDC054765]
MTRGRPRRVARPPPSVLPSPSPRSSAPWQRPAGGSFAHRPMRRVNRLGVSRCRLVAVGGLDLHVEALDAVDGTPVLDIKPWCSVRGPQGDVREPGRPSEMPADYYADPRA